MLLITLLSPFLGSLISGLFGRYIGPVLSKQIVIFTIFISMVLSYCIFIEVVLNDNEITLNILPWLTIDTLEVDWAFTIDKLSGSMLIPVTTISFFVHIFAYSYMSSDPHQPRFFSYLSLFTFFMLILVTGNSYLTMFIGWEFVGVTSYLLISFWFTRITAMKSALSAVLLNRMGDTFFIIGMLLLFSTFGSLNFDSIFTITPYIETNLINLIMLCFIIATTAKSAQFGLHSWLLMAMEGPTPVSSLLHAATMVTAGVYLLMRSSPILEFSPMMLGACLALGGITTGVAGLIAIVSNDIKRVIALSTMSQIGMMVIAVGVSAYNLALFHLVCHSVFKALLFMSAGAIIHSVINESQDLRTYGGFLPFLPLTYTCILIASLSLMAIPSLTGFYSKDIILETLIGSFGFSGFAIYWLALLSATLTSLYSMRILYLTFFNTPNSPKYTYLNLHEMDYVMVIPMFILAIGSIFVGYISRDIYLGMGSPFNALFIHPNNLHLIETEFALSSIFKVLPLILGLGGSFILLYIYEFNYKLINVYDNSILNKIYFYLNQKVFSDQLLNNYIIRGGLNLGGILNQHIDKGLLKIFGPNGLWALTKVISLTFNKLSYGSVFSYGLVLVISITMVTLCISISNVLVLLILLSIFTLLNLIGTKGRN